ncbi:MAG: hypothetical protein A3G49_01220 [Candidatus Sungbacteria bacterium RIFCSPLOWO2_12_FULL_41_11]|uniref:Uncharacterized protein n=1 Tax=Candidatus Sungbacteria bacterium RIFCSPLOWO2_12_FULL_41_11 TaxID=1802286 RepID=A0A1G2LNR9_9BACT|nr:MAG: hypothetical protein UV01_C0006G0004 [Parcubacteria group bacterium GW2011_GWA2_42_14]OHA13255.1 MAG: hypothetical protein A3G49_01220 [Candidatus Sungbacteria bacterium RIFCSPLOWO2_12_FULL_41_11]
MAKKQMTNEKLAQMIAKGFENTASKQDLLAIEKRLGGIDGKIEALSEGLRLVRDDVHDLKVAMGPLVRTVVDMENVIRSLHMRLNRVERKVGLAR